MLLNKSQAEIAYLAMSASDSETNNVKVEFSALMRAKQMPSGAVYVTHDTKEDFERHKNKDAFAAFYGLH